MIDLFMHPVEREARRVWEEREQELPAFVRQTWQQGTSLARRQALLDAADRLDWYAQRPV